jgi:hypothetical protein
VTGYGLDGLVLLPAWHYFSLLHSILTESGAHPVSYSVDTGGDFPRSKAAGVLGRRSPPSSAEVKSGGAIAPLPHMSSWHNSQLIKHRNLTFITSLFETKYTMNLSLSSESKAFM